MCLCILHKQGSADMEGQIIRLLNIRIVGWNYTMGF